MVHRYDYYLLKAQLHIQQGCNCPEQVGNAPWSFSGKPSGLPSAASDNGEDDKFQLPGPEPPPVFDPSKDLIPS